MIIDLQTAEKAPPAVDGTATSPTRPNHVGFAKPGKNAADVKETTVLACDANRWAMMYVTYSSGELR